MGLTAERVARHYGIAREQADEFALESHQKALAAQAAAGFRRKSCPCRSRLPRRTRNRRSKKTEIEFKVDEGPRADTSLEALIEAEGGVSRHGTVTAGNSSQTSDGAAAAVVMSKPNARKPGNPAAGALCGLRLCRVPAGGNGDRAGLRHSQGAQTGRPQLDQIDLIELNEAFAAQALAVIKVLGLDMAKVNVNGGAIALGHPLGCTGAKLTATLLQEMKRRKARYGMVTMCVGGGMGAAGIFENLN
jgi:acetyl-CoA acyltransferase